MHIPDGYLSPEVAVATTVVSLAVVCSALRVPRQRAEGPAGAVTRGLDGIPLVGVTAAFIFAVQMLNFPVAHGTSGHLLGAALAAVLLGPWLGCLTVAAVLAMQALLFADGGIAALGANVLNMAVLGALLTGLVMARMGVSARGLGAGSAGGRGSRGAAGGPAAFLAVVAGAAWLSVMA
ncbi:MAG TPA: energy-coupling factor ABC transporter permease, partial [Conexibacter sp.]|nr:energy-coupling factor ABC transporter permease [Conexibacter sp.]